MKAVHVPAAARMPDRTITFGWLDGTRVTMTEQQAVGISASFEALLDLEAQVPVAPTYIFGPRTDGAS